MIQRDNQNDFLGESNQFGVCEQMRDTTDSLRYAMFDE